MQSAYQMKKKNPKVASSFAYATFKVGVLTNSMQMIEEAISLIKSMATRHPNNPVVFSTYGHVSGDVNRSSGYCAPGGSVTGFLFRECHWCRGYFEEEDFL